MEVFIPARCAISTLVSLPLDTFTDVLLSRRFKPEYVQGWSVQDDAGYTLFVFQALLFWALHLSEAANKRLSMPDFVWFKGDADITAIVFPQTDLAWPGLSCASIAIAFL